MGQNSALCGLSQIKRSAKKKNNYIIYIEESLSFSDCVSPTDHRDTSRAVPFLLTQPGE